MHEKRTGHVSLMTKEDLVETEAVKIVEVDLNQADGVTIRYSIGFVFRR